MVWSSASKRFIMSVINITNMVGYIYYRHNYTGYQHINMFFRRIEKKWSVEQKQL